MPSYTAGNPQPASEFFVPDGDYSLKVVEASDAISSNKNPQIKLKLRVLNKDGSAGLSLFDYLVFCPVSFWKIDAFLKSCDRHPGEGVTVNIEPDDLIGVVCRARLVVETYNGKKSNKVDTYLFDEF